MEKIDITKNELYITDITRVVKSYIVKSYIKKSTPRSIDGFIMVTEGECVYDFIGGKRTVATAGSLLYLAKNSIYDMTITSERYSFIYCDFEFMSDEPRESAVYPLKNHKEVTLLFEKMLVAFAAKHYGYQSDCAALLYQIYAKVLRSPSSYSAPKSRGLAYKAQSYILQNLHRSSLSVAEVARHVGISEVHLRRIFCSAHGTSPSKYLAQARILTAKELMSVDGLTLTDIAEQCGYSSLPYFCKAFKEITGHTPAALMRSLKRQ